MSLNPKSKYFAIKLNEPNISSSGVSKEATPSSEYPFHIERKVVSLSESLWKKPISPLKKFPGRNQRKKTIMISRCTNAK
jgi:hypothetical protein